MSVSIHSQSSDMTNCYALVMEQMLWSWKAECIKKKRASETSKGNRTKRAPLWIRDTHLVTHVQTPLVLDTRINEVHGALNMTPFEFFWHGKGEPGAVRI